MSDVINEDDAVGSYMEVTLVNNMIIAGTVFSFNHKEGLLTLLQDISDHSTVKMIRVPYIKEYTIRRAPEDKKLPHQLNSFCCLPSMHAGRDKSIFKYANLQLKAAESNAAKHVGSLDPSAPIAAFDAFSKIARIYPDVSWDKEEQVIRVTNSVFIAGEPDWRTPEPQLVKGAPEKEAAMVDRLKKALEAPNK